MGYTLDDLIRLDRMIARGTTRITIEGKTIEYRSMEELLAARKLVVDDIAGQLGKKRVTRYKIVAEKDL